MACNPVILHEQFNDQVFSWLYEGDDINVRKRSLLFDWQQRSNTWGTPLLALMSGRIWEAEDRTFEKKVALAKWAISLGARPEHHAPIRCEWWIEFPWEDLVLGGNSALSLVSNALDLGLASDYPHQTPTVYRLRVFWELLTAAVPPPAIHRVSVRDAVPKLWECILQDTANTDFEFVTPQGSVCAHVAVLREACPNLLAAKSQPTTGEAVKEQVSYSKQALQHLTSLLYCGMFAEGVQVYESECSILVEIAEAAITFGAQVLLPLLILHLRCQLESSSFGAICAFALRHGHESLLADCRYFAGRFYWDDHSPETWECFCASLPPSVQRFVRAEVSAERRLTDD
mmetsp:Transcript_742/g.2008  ORF Transcript_742/g.2008 Transcript_742/m.2008 type:complete len:344 (-) Transcript_742:40-1071(-)